MKKVIFFHIATINHYQKIVDEIINLIIDSGLINDVDKINIGIVGNGFVDLPINNKINILYQDSNLELFEFKTLNLLKGFARENESYNILYIHTKGTNSDTKPINDWRKYMLYFLVEKYNECFKILENFDTCGVDLRKNPTLHYSGNFWWANSNHIKNLPEFKDMGVILSERHKAEFWICLFGKHYSMWDCGIDVYQRHLFEYPKNKYVNHE